MLTTKSSLALAAAMMLSSCATPPTEQISTLATQTSCCSTLSELPYPKLALDAEQKVNIGPKSAVFEFPEGKSYFLSYAVEGKARRYINLRSYFNGMMIGQFFQPRFLFLNERYEPISTVDPEMGFADARLFSIEPDAHMFTVVAVPEAARYVVIYAIPGTGSDIATVGPSTGIFMAGRVPVLTSSPGKKIPLTRTATGSLKLRLVDY